MSNEILIVFPYFVGQPSLSVYDRPTSIPPAICQILNKIGRNRLHASQMNEPRLI